MILKKKEKKKLIACVENQVKDILRHFFFPIPSGKEQDLIFENNMNERYCDVVRHVRTRIRFAMLRTTLIALQGNRGKKMDKKYETPLSEVSYYLIPAPMME